MDYKHDDHTQMLPAMPIRHMDSALHDGSALRDECHVPISQTVLPASKRRKSTLNTRQEENLGDAHSCLGHPRRLGRNNAFPR